MNMRDTETYYIIYSPKTIRMYTLDFSWDILPDYMKKGYYITTFPAEPWNIKFQGSFFQCRNVLHAINAFVYN